MENILISGTAIFLIHCCFAALGWGVLLQAIWAGIVNFTGATPPVIPPTGPTAVNHVGLRIPTGWYERITELIFLLNAFASVYFYNTNPTYSAFHEVMWSDYVALMWGIVIVGIACEFFPWLEMRVNVHTREISTWAIIWLIFTLLIH